MKLVIIELHPRICSEHAVLNVPDDMDVKKEKEQWFKSKASRTVYTLDDFVAHLISKGATRADIETIEL